MTPVPRSKGAIALAVFALLAPAVIVLLLVLGTFSDEAALVDKNTQRIEENRDRADIAKERATEAVEETDDVKRRLVTTIRVLEEVGVLVPGPRGFDGDPGRLGPSGDQGVPGESIVGADGPPGEAENGADGVDGIDGADGETGPAGADGQAGPQGETGATGEQGGQGPPGVDGQQGATGPQGPPVQSFTFTHLGVTYTCEDPELDGSFACTP